MKKIKLTQNKYAIVDDEDFDILSQWKWFYSTGYGYRKEISMHRQISNAPKGMEIDHINGNRHKKWQAKITHLGKDYHLGMYENKKDAVIAYNKAAKELFGEFAKLNKLI